MKQFKIVFQFELFNYIKKKGYIAVTLVLMGVIAIVLSIPVIQNAGGDSAESAAAAVEQTAVAFVDETGSTQAMADYYSTALGDMGYEFIPVDMTRQELEQAVDSGQYTDAVIQTGPLAYTRIVQNISLYDAFDSAFSPVMLTKYKADALLEMGVPASGLAALESAQITADVQTTESGKDQSQTFFYTYILIFALYMAILLYGQFVASGVATEKSSRAMELLITSADPRSLIFGKVLGTGTAGLLQFVLILGTGYVAYTINADYYAGNFIVQSIFAMPLDVLLYAVLFFVLGFFMYAFLYAALGSLVSRMEDLSTTIMPVTFLFIIAFIVVMFSLGSGNVENPLILACSFIPFTSPMAMFTRITMSTVPVWQIVLSVGILAVSAVLIGLLATAIYRLGVLMYGKPPKVREILNMLKQGK